MPNDKPIVQINAAQQAAATAKQIAAATEAASTALTAVPGAWPEKNIVLAVLSGVGVAAGVVTAFATMGVSAAIMVAVPAIATYVGGLYSASPTATAKFGTAAK
jgi:hypothetical protein